MTIEVELEEASRRLATLVAAALEGADVIILEAGVPQVRLVPIVTRDD